MVACRLWVFRAFDYGPHEISATWRSWSRSTVGPQLGDGVPVWLVSALRFNNEAVESSSRLVEVERQVNVLRNSHLKGLNSLRERTGVVGRGEDNLALERLLIVARHAREAHDVVGAFPVEPAELARRWRNEPGNPHKAQKFKQV